MTSADRLTRVPWDSAALGCEAWELRDADPPTLRALGERGHYTVRVDPLASKAALHEAGFYYCDTLIEPWSPAGRWQRFPHPAAGFEREPPLGPLLEICRSAFRHDRFHRDFRVERRSADRRYENWLTSLHGAGRVYALTWEGRTAGFIAHEDGRLVLHALAEAYRGRGLARYLWTAVCEDLESGGATELSSSISAANTAALSLYARLGFRFRNPKDIYHRVIS